MLDTLIRDILIASIAFSSARLSNEVDRPQTPLYSYETTI